MPPLAERIEQGLNPILVKELCQASRRRDFTLTVTLGLLAPLTCYLIFLAAGQSTGEAYFMLIRGCLGIVAWGVIPAACAQQLQTEIRTRTVELIALTALSPWEIASGIFQAAMLKLCLLSSFMLPPAVGAILMGGVSIESLVGSLIVIWAGCALLTSLMLSAGARSLSWPRLGGVRVTGSVLLSGLALGVFALLSAARGKVFPGGLGVYVWGCLVALAMTAFFLRLAADALSAASTRSYGLSKLAMLPVLIVVCMPVWTGTLILPASTSSELPVGSLLVALLFAYRYIVVWSASAEVVERLGPRWLVPLRNGFDAALVYAMGVTVILAALSSLGQVSCAPPLLFLCYYIFFSGLTALLHGFVPVGARTSEKYLTVFLLLVVASGVLTSLLAMWDSGRATKTPWVVLLPFSVVTAERIEAFRWYFALPVAVGIGAMLLARARNGRSLSGA